MNKNLELLKKLTLLLYVTKSSLYIFASVYDFPLPVLPNMPMWLEKSLFTPKEIGIKLSEDKEPIDIVLSESLLTNL